MLISHCMRQAARLTFSRWACVRIARGFGGDMFRMAVHRDTGMVLLFHMGLDTGRFEMFPEWLSDRHA
jgi:hypothetical protein